MKPTIIYPSNPLNPSEVDFDYREEKTMAELLGLHTSIIDYDALLSREFRVKHHPYPHTLGKGVIYRGWMMKPLEYDFLYHSLCERFEDFEWGWGELIVDPNQYQLTHHFPKVYRFIHEYTGSTWWASDGQNLLEFATGTLSEARSREITELLLKDYVKSEKNDPRLFYIGTSISPESLVEIFEEFRKVRGNLFDSGFVLKQKKPLKRYEDNKTNEWRAFILFGQIVSLCPNSNQPDSCPAPSREFVQHIASRIQSNFFTIDFAEDIFSTWFVLETGDGQVSGLSPNQNVLEFYNGISQIWESKHNPKPQILI